MVERGGGDGIESPTLEEWDLINDLVLTLNFFYQATPDISADSACVSLIIPFVTMLNLKLPVQEGAEESEDISKMKQQLPESLNKRFFYIKISVN